MKKLFLFCIVIMILQKIYAEEIFYKSGFQEFLVAQPTPEIQLNFTYNLQPNLAVTSISGLATVAPGTVTQATGMARLSVTTSSAAVAVLASNKRLNYQSGQGASAVFSVVFASGGINNNVQYAGIGNAQNGFFFGYTGTDFGILHRNANQDSWISQSNWNVDALTGASGSAFSLIPGCGNVYKIQYQWLGFGVINFYVQDPTSGEWVLAHTIRYPNSDSNQPSLANPSMQLLAVNDNIATTAQGVSMLIPCMAAFIEGKLAQPNVYSRFSRSNRDTNVRTTAIENSLTIRNDVVKGSLSNQAMVVIDSLSISNFGTTGGAAVIIYLNINPTFSGSMTYINVATNSVVQASTTNRVISSGRNIMVFYLNRATGTNGIYNVDLSDQKIVLAPGDVLAIGTQSTAGTLNNVGVSLSWIEKQ